MSSTIKFHYLKSPGYHNHHVDGAYGGINPRGTISMHFYSERNAIPTLTENEVDSKGTLGKIIKTEGKEGIIREIETGITIDVATAIAIHGWLGTMIEKHKEQIK